MSARDEELVELIRQAAIARIERNEARRKVNQAEAGYEEAGRRCSDALDAVYAHIAARIDNAALTYPEAGL